MCSKEVGFYFISYRPIVNYYLRIWLNRLDEQQFEEISIEMLMLHKSIKYIMESIFAISPLLALATSGWSRGIQGSYLLGVSHLSNVFAGILSNVFAGFMTLINLLLGFLRSGQ